MLPAAPGKIGIQTQNGPRSIQGRQSRIWSSFCLSMCRYGSQLVSPINLACVMVVTCLQNQRSPRFTVLSSTALLWSTCPNPLDENPFKLSCNFFIRVQVYEAKDFHGRDCSKKAEYRNVFFLGR